MQVILILRNVFEILNGPTEGIDFCLKQFVEKQFVYLEPPYSIGPVLHIRFVYLEPTHHRAAIVCDKAQSLKIIVKRYVPSEALYFLGCGGMTLGERSAVALRAAYVVCRATTLRNQIVVTSCRSLGSLRSGVPALYQREDMTCCRQLHAVRTVRAISIDF